jgi:hypothetical protein
METFLSALAELELKQPLFPTLSLEDNQYSSTPQKRRSFEDSDTRPSKRACVWIDGLPQPQPDLTPPNIGVTEQNVTTPDRNGSEVGIDEPKEVCFGMVSEQRRHSWS